MFCAGVAAGDDGRLVTAGGRVLDVVGRGPTVAEARRRAYAAIGRALVAGHAPPHRHRDGDRGGTSMTHEGRRSSWDRPTTRTRCSRRPTRSRSSASRPTCGCMSAHRNPARGRRARLVGARARATCAFICGAGMAAHLAGAVAAHTTLPVVGVPLSGGALNGVDALYATVQMPQGIPVATVAIDGAHERRAPRRRRCSPSTTPTWRRSWSPTARSAPRPDAQQTRFCVRIVARAAIRTQNRLVSLLSSGRGPTAAGSWPNRPAPRRRACRPAPARRPRPRRRPASTRRRG